MRRSISLATKLVGLFVAGSLLIGSVSAYLVMSLRQVHAEYRDVALKMQAAAIDAADIQANVYRQISDVQRYIAFNDAALLQDYDSAVRIIDAKMTALVDVGTTREQRAMAAQMLQLSREYADVTQRIFTMVEGSRVPEAEYLNRTTGSIIVKKLVEQADMIRTEFDRVSASAMIHADAVAADAQAWGVRALVAALVGGILVSILLARSISKPIRMVARTAGLVAAGDLTVEPLRITTRDESGEMADAFNRMVLGLRELVRGVGDSARSVMGSSEDLAAVSGQASRAAEGAATAVSHVAAGASHQAMSVEQVSRTMDELRQTIDQIAASAGNSATEVHNAAEMLSQMVAALGEMARNASGVAAGSDRAAGTARNGAAVVERTLANMQEIRSAVVLAAGKIRDLEELSAQIGAITQVISEIADQTNLLALNAAIEAARAGEHGRGFAVVAEEVRRLAERSASATKEITGLIHATQGRTAEAVHAMVAGTAQVEEGSRLAADAGRALKEILVTVEQAAADVGSIAVASGQVQENAQRVVGAFEAMAAITEENTAATEEMAARSGHVNDSVVEISRVSQENAAAGQQVSAAVEELTASAEEVARSAQALATVAQAMQKQVAQFKV